MNLREIQVSDKAKYIELTTAFYNSEAVEHKVDSANFKKTFDEFMYSDVYTECYIIEENSQTAGYISLSKTFSQEAGGICIWVEKLWIEPEFRGLGLGKYALKSVIEAYENATRFRLEYSLANASVSEFYKKLGFENLGYVQMCLDK